MKPSFTSFVFMLLVLTGGLYGASYYIFNRVLIMPGMPLVLMLGVLFLVTCLSHYIISKANDKSPQVFTRTYMALSTGRLLMYSIFVLAYCFGHRDIAKAFALTFCIFYIFYTFFEIRAVQSFLKK
jgi:hypothetical protein